MYSVSKEMSVQSYQVVQPAENQTDFTPGQIVRFTIPRQVGFFDAHLSKLQLQCRTQGATFKMCFLSPNAGVASMIDMIRVSQNGKVISEILEYSTLQHLLKGYENCLSCSQLDAVSKGLVDYAGDTATESVSLSENCLLGQGLNRSGQDGATAMEQDVKFQLTLDFISLFEVLHIVPSMAMGDVLIEIRLAKSSKEIMKVLPSSVISHTITPALGDPVPGGTSSVTLEPPFVGFSNLADSPFIKGMRVKLADATGIRSTTYEIQSLSQAQTTGVITMTFTSTITAEAGANGAVSVVIVGGTDGSATPADAQFILSRAELLLQVIKPPDQYILDIARQVESEGMMIDMDSFTTYRNTILAGIKSQTLMIPTTQARAKAVFSVPRRGNQSPAFAIGNGTDFDLNGKYSTLSEYRSQIDGEYYPNQPVDLTQFVGGWNFSQEHLREVEKAFMASGIPMRSLDGLKQNFVIARALSSYGSSTNLTGTPINVYLTYDGNGPAAPAGPLDVISFLHHSVRVAITPMGIEVMA